MEEDFEARVGTWLRRKWRLNRLIGIGGMAAVYEAEHKIGRRAAIKLLRPEIAVDETVRERFEQEALATNRVGHAGVVEVLDIDETFDGQHYLVMELLEGQTLADLCENEAPTLPKLLDYVDQTLDVLVACHRKGVIHRDIKPENLFITTEGEIKVLDFGIARVREGVKTRAGTMLGTVAFMAPEQLRGGDIDARADLFALGATMFAVLTGRRVHLADDDAKLAMKALSEPAPALHSVAPDLPEALGWVIDRALAYLPERRYPDAQTMRGDIWALQREGRPPYAYACNEAGQSPHVTSLDAPNQTPTRVEGTHPPGELPSTDPQLPAFASEPPPAPPKGSTEPQIPAFDADTPLEATEPAKPVLAPPPRPKKTLIGLSDQTPPAEASPEHETRDEHEHEDEHDEEHEHETDPIPEHESEDESEDESEHESEHESEDESEDESEHESEPEDESDEADEPRTDPLPEPENVRPVGPPVPASPSRGRIWLVVLVLLLAAAAGAGVYITQFL